GAHQQDIPRLEGDALIARSPFELGNRDVGAAEGIKVPASLFVVPREIQQHCATDDAVLHPVFDTQLAALRARLVLQTSTKEAELSRPYMAKAVPLAGPLQIEAIQVVVLVVAAGGEDDVLVGFAAKHGRLRHVEWQREVEGAPL